MPSTIISFRDVYYTYPGSDAYALKGISFDIATGGTQIILGGSGSGKSTILKLILGLIKPDAGRVEVNGEDITGMGESALMKVRADIGMVFQEGALFDSLSVAENVGFRLREHEDLSEEEFESRVRRMLGFVELSEFYDRAPSELSGGQRRRVALARAMAYGPQMILYDEPTTGLDPITAHTICNLIVKLRDLEGATSVMVTHRLQDAFHVAQTFVMQKADDLHYYVIPDLDVLVGTQFMVVSHGEILFEGRQKELFETSEPYVKKFLEGQTPLVER